MCHKKIDSIDFESLSSDFLLTFNETLDDSVNEYQKIINQISSQNKGNVYWWVSNLASRNIHESDLFLMLVKLKFLDKLIKNNYDIEFIYVQTMIEKISIEKHFGIGCKIKSGLINKKIRFSLFFWIFKYIKDMIKLVQFWLWAKWSQCLTLNEISAADLNILQVFSLPTSFDSGEFNDRYFTGLFEQIDSSINNTFIYLINIVNVKYFRNYFKKIKQSKYKFLIPIQWISFFNLIQVMGYPVQIQKITVDSILFFGLDVTHTIRLYLKGSVQNQSSYSGIIKYFFIKQMKEAGVSINYCLSWFENQSHDKGFYFALNRHYPTLQSIGYLGSFFHQYYFCFSPVTEEINQQVLPSQIAVFGKDMRLTVNRFCEFKRVQIFPTFRMNHVWKCPVREFRMIKNILVGLPILYVEATYVLDVIAQYMKEYTDSQYKFVIKFHPTHNAELKKKYDHLTIVEGSFSDALVENDALIALFGCTPVEAVALNIPTIILTDPSKGLFLNPFPKDIDKRLYKVCFTADDLYVAISEFNNRTQEERDTCKQLAEDIREGYFEPVTDSFSLMP
jgi:hypothetical protein